MLLGVGGFWEGTLRFLTNAETGIPLEGRVLVNTLNCKVPLILL